jgi:hypothetical protein
MLTAVAVAEHLLPALVVQHLLPALVVQHLLPALVVQHLLPTLVVPHPLPALVLLATLVGLQLIAPLLLMPQIGLPVIAPPVLPPQIGLSVVAALILTPPVRQVIAPPLFTLFFLFTTLTLHSVPGPYILPPLRCRAGSGGARHRRRLGYPVAGGMPLLRGTGPCKRAGPSENTYATGDQRQERAKTKRGVALASALGCIGSLLFVFVHDTASIFIGWSRPAWLAGYPHGDYRTKGCATM